MLVRQARSYAARELHSPYRCQRPPQSSTQFRRLIEEKHGKDGKDFYITSLTGDCVRIYPLPEWESIEQRLSLLPTMDPARRKFLDRTNYYGQQASIDGQGRLLVHP